MRGAARALREGFSLPARPPWRYGLLCGLATALPLLVGTLLGQRDGGAFVALGAYLTAFGDQYGQPYAKRAENLAIKCVLVAAGTGAGMLLAPYPLAAIPLIGLGAAAAGRWRAIGTPPVIAVVVGFYLTIPAGPIPPVEMALGGVWFSVLALALWPLRRLDPLNKALTDADEAVAALLGSLDLPGEAWDEARERASKALDAAATASAAFYSADDTARSPDEYVQTLVRIFHETIALRALRAAAVKDQERIDVVVWALADALCEAAKGRTGRVTGALAATAAFAEWIDHLRASLGSDADALRRIAILGQVRRSIDRLAVGVRTIGLFAAEGVRAPPRLPGLSWRPPTGGDEPEHAGRLGIAVAVAMALMLGVHEHYGKWFVFTVLMALRSTYGDTVERVVVRVSGTVLGAAVAAIVLALVPGRYTVAITVLVFATLGFALREVSFAYWSIFATPLAMMLTDFSTPLGWQTTALRLLLTVGGGLLALFAARVLWPRGEGGRLHCLTADVLREHANLIRTLAERDLDRVPESAEAAEQAADRLAESLDNLDKEPGGRAPPKLREALTLARKLRDDAFLVMAVMRGSQVGSDATVAVLDAVADRLAAVAQAVHDRRPPPEADEFEAGLGELAGEVSSLMAEAAAGDTSTIRRQLRHAVSAQPALKTLTADALKLAALITVNG